MVRRVICRVGKASCDSNHVEGKGPGWRTDWRNLLPSGIATGTSGTRHGLHSGTYIKEDKTWEEDWIFREMEEVCRQVQHMDHKRRRHCMIFLFSKQTSLINIISDCQATAPWTFTQKTEHFHTLQNCPTKFTSRDDGRLDWRKYNIHSRGST